MQKVFSTLFSFIPESNLKNKLRCYLYNRATSHFSIQFNGHFEVNIQGFNLKFIENPYHLLMEQVAYFKYYTPKKGDVVIDAGGFWGTFALLCSKLCGNEGQVYVFEPDPGNQLILKKNIALNKVNNITLIEKGLWDKKEVLKFHQKSGVGSSFYYDQEDQNIISVPTTTLDEEFLELTSSINFIKMDIEGAEIKAIEGASNLIKKHMPSMVIASYHIVDGEKTCYKVEEQLKNLGFDEVTTHTEKEVITYAN